MIPFDGHIYVPFAPFPAIAVMPLVALIGPVVADHGEPRSTALLAAATVGMCWWRSAGSASSGSATAWLALLLGFSTQICGSRPAAACGTPATSVATILLMFLLAEMFGRQRAVLMGLLVGAAFLTRAPLAFAAPVHRAVADPDRDLRCALRTPAASAAGSAIDPVAGWVLFAVGVLPSLAFFFGTTSIRFGDTAAVRLRAGLAARLAPEPA